MLTPIAKSWPSQWCLEANNLAIQVHGGYGYTRDYDVEQHYRDNRLNPIHEGTHGIQAWTCWAARWSCGGGAGLAALADADRRDGRRGAAARRRGRRAGGRARRRAGSGSSTVTAAMFGAGDLEAALANASVYLEAVGHVVVAWMWLEQVLAADGRDGDFYDGKRQAARYFFRYELPQTGAAARPAGEPGPHHPRDARQLVLTGAFGSHAARSAGRGRPELRTLTSRSG